MSTEVTASWCEKYLGSGDGNAALYCTRIVAQINEFAHHRANILMFFILRKDDPTVMSEPGHVLRLGGERINTWSPSYSRNLSLGSKDMYLSSPPGWEVMKASISRALSIMKTHRQSVCCSRSSDMRHWWLDSFFSEHTYWPYVLSFDPIIVYDLHIIIIIPPQAPDWWLAEPAFGLQAPVLGSQQFIRRVKCQINQDHWVWAAWDESHLQLEPLACHWHRWDSLRFCTEAGTRWCPAPACWAPTQFQTWLSSWSLHLKELTWMFKKLNEQIVSFI